MFLLFQICWWRPERVWSVPELRRAHGDVPLLLPGRLWTQPAEVPLVEEVRSQFYPQLTVMTLWSKIHNPPF